MKGHRWIHVRSGHRLPRPVVHGLIGLLIIACGSGTAWGQAAVRVPEPLDSSRAQAVQQARERIEALVAEFELPGVSVAVGLDGELLWAEGFGWADLEKRVPVTMLTRFRIGSISKPLTSAAVGLLHERGHLDLDAAVQKYVPGFPEKRWEITTRQLMSHTAGIRHYRGSEEVLSSTHYEDVVEGLEIFASDSLLFRPGTERSYSSYGWNLVGAVVQGAAGEPFLDFLRREVFAPIGMRQTVPDEVFAIIPHRASFYDRDPDGRLRNADYVDQSNKWASGGFLSTPSDLVRFGFAMLNSELLESETVDLLWGRAQPGSDEVNESGLGWGIQEVGGHPMIGHGGNSVGGRASLMVFPEQRMVISVMSNVTGAQIPQIVMTLVSLFDPATAP